MNRNKTKMALKIAIAPKKRYLFSCSFQNEPKQTDLFQNEPKQTENGPKNSNSTQKMLSFQLQFPKQTEKNRFVSKWTKTNRKGPYFNAISLKFWQIIGDIVVYNLWKFQIDSLQIKA